MNFGKLFILLTTQWYALFTFGQGTSTESRWISLEGVDLHYRYGGTGQPLLLLHGFTLSGEQWTPFLDELTQKYTVIAMDMPGHGQSGRISSEFSFKKWAGLMLHMLKEMGIDQVKAIGHSAGAITLMHMAAQAPEVMESMILISGGHRYFKETREVLRNDSFEKASKEIQQYYLDIHLGDTSKIKALFRDIHALADQIPVTPGHPPLSPVTLQKISVPVLLVWGDHDFYFPVSIAMELSDWLPDARLWVVPDQGHTPVWTSLGGDAIAESIFAEVAIAFFRSQAHH